MKVDPVFSVWALLYIFELFEMVLWVEVDVALRHSGFEMGEVCAEPRSQPKTLVTFP